jgi:hypothetical protein
MLKPVSPESSVTYVSSFDCAIDWKDGGDEKKREKAIQTYHANTREDPGKWRDALEFAEGAKATVFRIGIIPPATLAEIEDECFRTDKYGNVTTHRQAFFRCFLHSIRSIDGWEGQPDTREVGGVEYVDPEWLARVFCGHLRNVALEVGRVAWHWNQLDHATVKN